ncbi:MAG: tetratricopeptide repeat protein [Candidatus Riflebacteria bacterium]|nr:tetratricopeptide repeat protein [Candidatus Riflebacteria bacterium]
MPERAPRRTLPPRRQPPPPPAPQIGLLEKVVVVSLLGLGLVVLWLLISRQFFKRPVEPPTRHPTATPTVVAPPTRIATPSPSAQPTPSTSPVPDLATIRAHFREDLPFIAVQDVARVLEADTEAIAKDQSLVELEQNMERIDRKILYHALDEYHRKATTPRQKQVDRYFQSLVASKSFLFERYNLRKSLEQFEQLASDRQSPLAELAINKKGMLLVSQNPADAISAFSRQIREFPGCPLNGFASLMIGTCYRALEQDSRALSQYKETLEKYKTAYGEGGLPLEPFVRHALADTMIKMGDRDGARAELGLIVANFRGDAPEPPGPGKGLASGRPALRPATAAYRLSVPFPIVRVDTAGVPLLSRFIWILITVALAFIGCGSQEFGPPVFGPTLLEETTTLEGQVVVNYRVETVEKFGTTEFTFNGSVQNLGADVRNARFEVLSTKNNPDPNGIRAQKVIASQPFGDLLAGQRSVVALTGIVPNVDNVTVKGRFARD